VAKTMLLERKDLQKLQRYAYSLTANEADAYDLLQSAIETSLNRPADSVSKTISYIRMIMKNRFIDAYRHRQSFPLDDIYDHSPVSMDGSSLEDIVIAGHDLDALWTRLEPIDREVLFFWAVEGYSMSEIAEKLEVSRGTLLSRIHRLRKRLTTESDDMQRGLV
jgi:RNA polymerase sigma factor (sigma-70 family)